MHVIIDGYNFIYAPHQVVGLLPAAPDERLREQLVSRMSAYQELTGDHTTIVFDSHPQGRPRQVTEEHLGVQVIYSGPGVEADETVKELVRRSDHRRDMLIVTSDNELGTICRRLGAHVVDSGSFRRQVLGALRRHHEEQPREPLVKEEGVPDGEVDAWLQDLGLDEEDLEL